MRETASRTAVAIVAGDARRCELHAQCGGLSQRVFRVRDHRVPLRLGPAADVESLAALQRSIRSCPVNALTLVVTESSDQSHPEEH